VINDNPILKLKDVHYQWPGRIPFNLNIPNFSIRPAETVLLLGESGSGKSTLLSLICGTIMPSKGTINLNGIDLKKLSPAMLDQFRVEQIGIIFQQFNLLPFGNVLDNILLPLRFAPKRRGRVRQPKIAAEKLCRQLGLAEGLLYMRSSNLSVGQQQRVAAARALIGNPPLIVADEPTSALDAESQTTFLDLLFKQTLSGNTSLLMVSHDERLSKKFDRVIRMDEVTKIGEVAV
jgi:putative ABC transport system ATP-binding protein